MEWASECIIRKGVDENKDEPWGPQGEPVTDRQRERMEAVRREPLGREGVLTSRHCPPGETAVFVTAGPVAPKAHLTRER